MDAHAPGPVGRFAMYRKTAEAGPPAEAGPAPKRAPMTPESIRQALAQRMIVPHRVEQAAARADKLSAARKARIAEVKAAAKARRAREKANKKRSRR